MGFAPRCQECGDTIPCNILGKSQCQYCEGVFCVHCGEAHESGCNEKPINNNKED